MLSREKQRGGLRAAFFVVWGVVERRGMEREASNNGRRADPKGDRKKGKGKRAVD